MAKHVIKETNETPYVVLDTEAGLFEISGTSFANNAGGFYQPIIEIFETYLISPAPSTSLIFRLLYFNSVAQKYFAELINILKPIPGFKVIWYYEQGDDDLLSLGKKYERLFEINMDFVEY